MIAIVVVTVLLSLGVYVFSSIGLGKVFVKLGEQAWKGWVPIVNSITLYELGRYSALWVVGLFIPVANVVAVVVLVLAVNNVNRRLGHGGGFTLLYLVATPIWACVLGLGKSVDTGWIPGSPATGYVPFAPVMPLSMTPLSMTPAPPAPPAPAGHHVLTPVPPAPSAPPEPPEAPAQLAVALLPPPPAAFLAPAAPAPIAPPVPHGLPTGPPPFYVSARPAPTPAPAPPVLPAPPAPPAPSLVPAPPAPPVVSAPVVAPVNPWAPPAPLVKAAATPFAAVPRESHAAELPIALPGELAAAAAEIAARAVPAVPAAVPTAVPPAVPAVVPAPASRVVPVAVAAHASAVTPLAARAAHEDEPEDDDLDETMIVVRRMKPWTLETEHGLKVSLTKPIVLLGRNPTRGVAHSDAQLIPLHDPGKTVSKTHARLDFVDGAWGISDLHSTNGVVLIDGGGLENELDAGASAPLTDRFLLGELAARIYLEA